MGFLPKPFDLVVLVEIVVRVVVDSPGGTRFLSQSATELMPDAQGSAGFEAQRYFAEEVSATNRDTKSARGGVPPVEMRSSKTPPASEKTPNCVSCGRSLEHTVCTVLHMLGTGRWMQEICLAQRHEWRSGSGQ